jgi:hypothetical protein
VQVGAPAVARECDRAGAPRAVPPMVRPVVPSTKPGTGWLRASRKDFCGAGVPLVRAAKCETIPKLSGPKLKSGTQAADPVGERCPHSSAGRDTPLAARGAGPPPLRPAELGLPLLRPAELGPSG